MPATRKQKAKARKSRELDMLSDCGNMDVLLGDGNSNSMERELDSLIIVSGRRQHFQIFPNRENSSQVNEIRNIHNGICPTRRDGRVESTDILSVETDIRISQVMDSLMNILQMRIRRAIKDRVILELQNIVGALFSSGKESGTGMSTCHQDLSDRPGVSNNNLSKKDSRSACDLRDHTDFSPYNILRKLFQCPSVKDLKILAKNLANS